MQGNFLAKAVATRWGDSENGNTQIAVECEITTEGEFQGRTIAYIGTFTEKAREFALKALDAFGWQGDDLSELDNLTADGCAILLPNEVELVVRQEEYNGEIQTRVAFVNKPGAGRFAFKKPKTGSELKSFAATQKASVAAWRAGNGLARPVSKPQPAKRPTHPNAPGDDNDIPF